MNIQSLFHGYLRVEESDGALVPLRFSQSMLDFYDAEGEMTLVRSRCPAGVRLDAMTDAEEISFSYTCTRFCRDHLTFDVFENDRFMTTLREPDNSHEGRISYRRRVSGKGRVTIHLPYTADVHLRDLNLGAAEPVAPASHTMLALGDSITQGMTVLRPSQSYANLLARLKGVELVNQGVGSYVFNPESLGDVPLVSADEILVVYGTNDYTKILEGELTLSAFAGTVREYMGKLHGLVPSTPVYVITPIWRSQQCGEPAQIKLMQQVRGTIASAAGEQGFAVIHGLDLLGHDESLLADGLHPNDLGANMMAMNLFRQLSRY